MDYLWNHHRDTKNGGYFWSLDNNGPVDSTKQGYGHAFVLLAASAAKTIGHPLADAMLADITEILEQQVLGAEARRHRRRVHCRLDRSMAAYRGQNSNMHLTEALMAAFEATGDRDYLAKAESIADLVIRQVRRFRRLAGRRALQRRMGARQELYHPNEMFRPAGTTPGHWLEWARLILQLWALGGKRHRMDAGCRRRASSRSRWHSAGTDEKGGFFYTLDWDDKPAKRTQALVAGLRGRRPPRTS